MKFTEIKNELDTNNEYQYLYKGEGYKAYVLLFEKHNDIYSVTDHLSTASGYEEDLDYFESKDWNEIEEYIENEIH